MTWHLVQVNKRHNKNSIKNRGSNQFIDIHRDSNIKLFQTIETLLEWLLCHRKYNLLCYHNFIEHALWGEKVKTKLKMIYWKGEKFWVGKLVEHPEIMTQGETLEELEENMKDAYMLMTMEDVPEKHKVKELTLSV